jgi:pimeloyl-ACP methyl ester carboxylesterase
MATTDPAWEMKRTHTITWTTVGIVAAAALLAVLSVPVVRSGFSFLAWRALADTSMEKGFVQNGDARISYTTYGNGPVLVLLHGGLSSGLDWLGEIPAFARKFTVVVINFRGHADSSLGDASLTYDLLATDVVAVLDKLKIQRASILGWSDGGNTGLLFALDYPDRIDRLIAISANYDPAGIDADVMRDITESPEAAGSWVSRWLYRLQSSSPEKWAELQDRVVTMWRNYPRLTKVDLQRIKAPTLLIVGARDDIEQAHAAIMAAAIPHARLLVIPGVGHSVPRDAPGTVIEAGLAFLSGD